ncbi:MAG: hypothetical protein WD824_05780 [Cyclobacteriaceae bacterium]
MKKVLSVMLLMAFLFNVGGYYIVFWGLRFQSDQQLTSRLDANLYEPEETIELKIPVALPYPIQSQDFQRVNGRFEHGGEFYKLVKHKLENDTLYVVCIRDHQTRELVNTMTDYVQLTQALPGTNTANKALNFLSKLVKDFCSHQDINMLHQYGFSMLIVFTEIREFFLQPVISVHAPPPKA